MSHLKRIAKVSALLFAGLLGLAILHSLLVVFPQPLLRHRVSHANFTVYAPEPFPPEIHPVLDRSRALLAASTIDEPDLRRKVYLLNSYRLMRFLLVRNVHFGAILITGGIYIADGDATRDVARCKKLGPRDNRQRTLSGAIVHEATHDLIRRRVGFWEDRRLPTWVKEGYCDFISRENAIAPSTGFAILDRRTSGRVRGYAYLEYRLVVDYLLTEKGMTIEQILDQPPDYYETLGEVLRWSRENRERIRSRWLDEGPPPAVARPAPLIPRESSISRDGTRGPR